MDTFEYVATVRIITEAKDSAAGEALVREQLEQITFDIESIEEV